MLYEITRKVSVIYIKVFKKAKRLEKKEASEKIALSYVIIIINTIIKEVLADLNHPKTFI